MVDIQVEVIQVEVILEVTLALADIQEVTLALDTQEVVIQEDVILAPVDIQE